MIFEENPPNSQGEKCSNDQNLVILMASTSRKYSKNMFFSKNNMICLARFDFVLENPLKKTLKLENNLFPFKNIFFRKVKPP